MMGLDNPLHLIFIALIALLVLGPKRLPVMARSLGTGMREFRASLTDHASAEEAPTVPAAAPVVQPVQLDPAQASATAEHTSDRS